MSLLALLVPGVGMGGGAVIVLVTEPLIIEAVQVRPALAIEAVQVRPALVVEQIETRQG